ncbi:hypothetical protein T4B_5939 [Trichinella pseudospiralis]|uniref:Uncharacterized protein n=1 Tax=Trichinella pseudospiralis TaxID=6337 RepID=A0A0V1IF28_TRIPS|nr:hypothetical protein T4B_5939 [Trichinella pseudospiralis]
MTILADEGNPCVGLCLLVISFGMFRCSKCLSSSSICNSDQLTLLQSRNTADTSLAWLNFNYKLLAVLEHRDTRCRFNIPCLPSAVLVLQTCDICKCLQIATPLLRHHIYHIRHLNSMLQHFFRKLSPNSDMVKKCAIIACHSSSLDPKYVIQGGWHALRKIKPPMQILQTPLPLPLLQLLFWMFVASSTTINGVLYSRLVRGCYEAIISNSLQSIIEGDFTSLVEMDEK